MDIAGLRHAYERGDETVAAICARFAISERSLRRRAKREGWAMRGHKPRANNRKATGSVRGQAATLKSLWRLLDEQIAAASNDADDAAMDKRARQLASLTKTLEQLLDLQKRTLAADESGSAVDVPGLLATLEKRLGLEPGGAVGSESG